MTGEDRHERCRFGQLTKAWRVELSGRETPAVIPVCGWQLPEPCPPPVRRIWGGNAVEPDTDCATCEAYSPL